MNQVLKRLKQERRRALLFLIAAISIITIGQMVTWSVQGEDAGTSRLPTAAGPSE